MNKKKIAVGMSGGVDSSVTALILKKRGFDVFGLFIKSWEEEGNCTSTKDFEDVIKVCEKIKIPYYSLNLVDEYKDKVFARFLEEYAKGFTPNPDILCNKEIKFKILLKKALDLKADFLATGHYARKDRQNRLLKAKDPDKDQSYFLYTLNQEILKKVLFPIGNLGKSEVRKMAKEANLCTYDKKNSTGICFIGERKFAPFLSKYLGTNPGNFETLKGEMVGKHEGLFFYTIGQRKGLKIGGRGEAWFVVGKDIKRNVVYVEQGQDNPALFQNKLIASDLSWVEKEPKMHCSCTAKIRYRQKDQKCTITKIENGLAYVEFPTPQRAITPQQSIVFYNKNRCLGGGIIRNP